MHTLPSRVLTGLDVLLERHGIESAQLLHDVGLDPQVLKQPNMAIPGQPFLDLIEHCAQTLNHRFFGLQLASIQGAAILGPLWFFLRSSFTVEEGLRRLVENFSSHTTVTYWDLLETKQGIILCYGINPALKGECTQTIELGLGIVSDSAKMMFGDTWRPKRTYLKCSDPYNKGPMRSYFGDNIVFNQDFNGILVTHEELSRTVDKNSILSHQYYQHEFERHLDFKSPSIVSQAENIINTSLTKHPCSLEFVATCLNINPRTLRHHLTRAGTSYQTLLTQAKLNLALEYLKQSNLNIAQIAERLHFSESAAFTRFIKKHTGKTPKAHRNVS